MAQAFEQIQIKLRAWHSDPYMDYPEMLSHERLDELDKEGLIHLFDIINLTEDHLTLMRWTGLKDKRGAEIFESDIVKWDDDSNGKYWRVAVVEIKPDIQFRIVKNTVHPLSIKEGYVFRYGCFIYTDTENHLEVIGNIYEHPHLLSSPMQSLSDLQSEEGQR